MYDYGARFYMPDIGRWGVVDMLNAFTLDSYGYANNNPVFFNDPTGMIGEDPKKEAREITIEEVQLVHVNKIKVPSVKELNMPYFNRYVMAEPSAAYAKMYDEQLRKQMQEGQMRSIVRNNGSAMMMSGDVLGLSDLLGILLSKVETKNRYAMMGIPLIAILATKGKAIDDVVKVESNATLAEARALGVAGEEAVGVSGAKTQIPSLTGTANYRIPDILTSTTLQEVKNVKSLSFTSQLKDFYMYSQQNGLQMILHTRQSTVLSAPLQKLINEGQIIQKTIPGK